jgi:hypothetical protein
MMLALWGAMTGLHFRRFATFPRRGTDSPPTNELH